MTIRVGSAKGRIVESVLERDAVVLVTIEPASAAVIAHDVEVDAIQSPAKAMGMRYCIVLPSSFLF